MIDSNDLCDKSPHDDALQHEIETIRDWTRRCDCAIVASIGDHADATGDHAMLDITNMTKEDLAALVPQLLAKLEEANKPKALTCKVSDKGALSVYGLGRFPVTLYRGQWERVFAARQQIADFIKANGSLLSTKGE